MADAKTGNTAGAEKPAAGKSRTIVIGCVSMVVLFETAMFFFLVPSAEEISALAEARLVQSVQQSQEVANQKSIDDDKVEEFKLGIFGETFSPIDTERQFRVELKLYGLVRKKNAGALKAEFDTKEGRIRHAIRMKIRNSELSELQENQLGLLQRRILTTCNHLIEGDLLLGVGFNDYQLIEE
ncbi:MAG: dihydrolipoamide acetyltransferase [Planctomycetaceae bacterium]